MPSTSKYFISAFLIFFAVSLGRGQQKNEEKPKKDFSPTGIRVGTDLIDLGKTFSGKTFQGWEINGDMDFANYHLAVDIGSWARDLKINNGSYSNAGGYYRLGIDVNLLGKDPDKNMLFFGFRVGHAQFNEALSYHTLAPPFTPPNLPAFTQKSNASVTGGWGEFTTGLRVKVWKGLWMGYTARMKFAPGVKGNSSDFVPYDMPGYGIISNKLWWGFNYQAFWRFAWKKDKPIKK